MLPWLVRPPQIQTRDLQGFVETRQRILDLKPANRNNWISFALAHHANKSFEVAVQVLDAYRKTLSEEVGEAARLAVQGCALVQGMQLGRPQPLLPAPACWQGHHLGRLRGCPAGRAPAVHVPTQACSCGHQGLLRACLWVRAGAWFVTMPLLPH